MTCQEYLGETSFVYRACLHPRVSFVECTRDRLHVDRDARESRPCNIILKCYTTSGVGPALI